MTGLARSSWSSLALIKHQASHRGVAVLRQAVPWAIRSFVGLEARGGGCGALSSARDLHHCPGH
eukprot:CAMPEP_0172065604 /NCGR_PEP_ID=MMETSP1043-20130122/10723_1 /TAXON_ID=464988 /ORGANISM="Hemiselmis andersenii, Strain CCMP441" /LENGTH=63 /DNA_ID=CAMNT_0012725721 /DNA_START=124 /DNA_END=312 /DNA_ORIENTATION=+